MGNTLTLKHTSKKVVFVVFLFVILLLLQLISNMKPEVKLGMATWNLWGNVTFDANLNQAQPYSQGSIPNSTTDGLKNILIWNNPERLETAIFGLGHEPFIEHQCEVSECAVYDKKSSNRPFEEYDAIIVHMLFLELHHLPNFERTNKQQRFIFFTQEPPPMMPIQISNIENVFNWTMSYKLNSDIQLLYGRITPGPTAPRTSQELQKLIKETHLPSTMNYSVNKTRPVVWMVSHCSTDSSRDTYVQELRRFIPVDVYGRCGNLSCNRDEKTWISHPQCYVTLQKKYKFYVSFENSICNDYVTEKFFEIMKHDMVPVVYEGANYSKIAPPHSYINALEYTPQKLAQYLQILHENDTLYNEYFWWKSHYNVEVGWEQMAGHGFCDLCKKLHQDQLTNKYYPELVSEWHPNTQCRRLISWVAVNGTPLNSPFVFLIDFLVAVTIILIQNFSD